MNLNSIYEDLKRNGCDDFFTESFTSVPVTSDQIKSVTSVVNSFSKTFIENLGLKVKNEVSQIDENEFVVESEVMSQTSLKLGTIRHRVVNKERLKVHFAEHTEGLDSEDLIRKLRTDGQRIIGRMTK